MKAYFRFMLADTDCMILGELEMRPDIFRKVNWILCHSIA